MKTYYVVFYSMEQFAVEAGDESEARAKAE